LAQLQLEQLDGKLQFAQATDFQANQVQLSEAFSQALDSVSDHAAAAVRSSRDDARRALVKVGLFGRPELVLLAFLLYVMVRKVIKPLEFLQRMLDVSGDAMLVIDSRGVIKMANEGAGRMFGYAMSALLGMPARQLFVMNDELHAVLAALEIQEGRSMPVEGMGGGGEHFHALLTINRYMESNGSPLH
ncbi:hypothetical protein C3E97_031080, partial [Pseudomonas sp. MWU12-2115]|uniref:PAS domain S-box protein n=1 Tax=Pseudomonas sp. MWU12-2115 TaxID=2071713 RepID=UPI000DDA419B